MITGVSSNALSGLPQLRAGRLNGAQAAEGQTGRTQKAGTQGASGQDTVQTPEQQQQIQELQRADTSVRQHEAAHQATGGPYAGGASFTYTRGPDGKNYATAGEVPVDTSPERDPQATVRKMETVKAAALAPADPSPQDLRVAQQADATKAQAQQQMRSKASGQGGEAGSGRFGGGQFGDGQFGGGLADSGSDPSGNAGPGNGTAAPALAARGAAAYGAAFGLGRRVSSAGITV
mgnify:CR=1 FL=1|jgi:SprA-related family.